MRQIKDRFTNLPISRQRKYQLRKKARGLCEDCGQPALKDSVRCRRCLIRGREQQRQRLGCKRRYFNTIGYARA